MTATPENNVAAQAGDEPMREAFFAWFAEHGSVHQYKESQDAFCAGYQAATPPDEPEPTEAYWGVAANGARCAFGRYGFAKAWAGKNGTVETVQLRQFTLIEPQFSPRATPAVTEALQVCVKALEFRKERSANDEFALNLARIALAEAPRATADVEREKLPHGHRDDFHLIANARALAMEPIHRIKSMPNWVLVKELFATGSTSAHEICAKAGIDPDGYGVPRATTKPGA